VFSLSPVLNILTVPKVGLQTNLKHSNEMELSFLSNDLFKFCSYDDETHENNYFISSTVVSERHGEELDMPTNFSSKDEEEYLAYSSEDYSDARRQNDKNKMSRKQVKGSKNAQVRKFASPKTDKEVVETQKSGITERH